MALGGIPQVTKTVRTAKDENGKVLGTVETETSKRGPVPSLIQLLVQASLEAAENQEESPESKEARWEAIEDRYQEVRAEIDESMEIAELANRAFPGSIPVEKYF